MKSLRNIRIISFNATGTLLSPHAGTQSTLHTLQFMGYRLVATIPTNPPLGTMAQTLGVAPVDILHIGEDLNKDVNAAQAAGIRAAWLAPCAHSHPKGAAVLRQLTELPELLRNAETAHLQHKPDRRSIRNLIASLRGLPEETPWSPTRRHENPESPIGTLVLEVASKLRTKNRPLAVLKEHWAQIINAPKLASKSEPHTITKNGILAIHCEDAVVRTDIEFLKDKILAAIRQHPACTGVKGVKFHV